MPQIKAAKKALRQSNRRRQVNDRWRRRLRESIYKLRDAAQGNDAKATTTAYQTAQQNIDRAAARNIIHRNKASRLKSQLTSFLRQPN